MEGADRTCRKDKRRSPSGPGHVERMAERGGRARGRKMFGVHPRSVLPAPRHCRGGVYSGQSPHMPTQRPQPGWGIRTLGALICPVSSCGSHLVPGCRAEAAVALWGRHMTWGGGTLSLSVGRTVGLGGWLGGLWQRDLEESTEPARAPGRGLLQPCHIHGDQQAARRAREPQPLPQPREEQRMETGHAQCKPRENQSDPE